MKVAAYLSLLLGVGALYVAAGPLSPLLLSPGGKAHNGSTSTMLQVKVSGSNGENLPVRHYGRLAVDPSPDVITGALPSSHYYSSTMNGATPATSQGQTDWLLAFHLVTYP